MPANSAAVAVATIFPASDQATMVAIAGSESGYDPTNTGDFGLTDRPQATDGSTSWGLWQINSIHETMLTQYTGSSNPDDWEQWLFVPANNAKAALNIYQSQGLGAWSTYNDGAYLNYMTDAQNALANTPASAASVNGSSSSTSSNTVSQFVALVQAQVGKPYTWGASGPNSFDCSGLVYYVFNQFGVSIGRTTFEEYPQCTTIAQSLLQPGDLLFQEFDSNGQPNHVGIYIGNNTVVAAPHTGATVQTYSLAAFGAATAARYGPMAAALQSDMASYLSGNGGSGGTAGGGTPSFFGPLDNITLPATNFEVKPNSAQYGQVLYGRKWQIIVSDLNGDIALDVSQLHCKFSLYKTMLVQPNLSTVTIYNLSPETENAIIQEGYRCVVSGGYVGSQYGMLMDFNVIQPIRYKENGTDYVLTLSGMDSDIFFAYGTANFTLLRGQNSRQIIGQVASSCSVPTAIGQLSPSLSMKGLSRGKVVYGMAADILRQIAKSEGMTYYMEDGKINFIHPSDLPTDEIIDLTPQTGLLGVPTQNGPYINAQMLLNPGVKIATMVHIDNSLVQNQQYSTGQPIYQLDQSGLYRVVTLTHAGDTRGSDWTTEIQAVGQSGTLPNMISSGSQNPY